MACKSASGGAHADEGSTRYSALRDLTPTSNHASDASVTPDAQLPPLDDRQVNGLREVGRRWAGHMPAREVRERALPVDPHLKYWWPSRRGAAYS